MSKLFFIVLLFVIFYAIDLSATMKLFPLNNDVCVELLQLSGLDVSDLKIVRYDLDAKSTLHTGQSPTREVFRLFIDYEKDSQTHNTTFLIKAPISSLVYNVMYKFGVYEKEYLMYSQILPEMLKLEDQSFAPKFVAGDDTKYINTLILEDLYMLGYKKADLLEPLDVPTCKLVVQTLARFHALSVILDKRGLIPEIVKEFPQPENEYEEEAARTDSDTARTYFDQGMNHFIQNLNSEIKEKYADKLESMKDNITDKVQHSTKDGLKVITHGNFIANELLFKYNDETRVEQVKFINFITAKWDSPLIDIFYLAIGSMKFEHVEQHFDTLLEIYSNAMNELFEKYKIDLYTLDDLKNDIRKQHLTFMWICGVILPLLSNPDMPVQQDGYSFKEPLSADNMAIAYSNRNYVDAASKWFMFFAKRGVFDD